MKRLARTLLPLFLLIAAANAQDKMEVKDEGTAGSLTLMGLGAAPASFSNKLYNIGGALYWNGTQLLTNGSLSGWSLTGNTGTVEGTHFIGTTDDVALDFRVNNARGLRIEFAQDDLDFTIAPNLIGGFSGNAVTEGMYGATISGGGTTGLPNTVTQTFGAVCGGFSNTAGYLASVTGGSGNTASGGQAAILGGSSNTASGSKSIAIGGRNNHASGDRSFALGDHARAAHRGAFVWSDVTDPNNPMTSTAENQFLIRASGGVGVNKNDPATALDVNGTVTTNALDVKGALAAARLEVPGNVGFGITNPVTRLHVRGGDSKQAMTLDGDLQRIVLRIRSAGIPDLITDSDTKVVVTGTGRIGIGTTTPNQKLHVEGDALANAHTTPSSRRWKTNIQTIDNAMETVRQLRGVTYDWKKTGKRDIGLIAEEVGAVIPEIVTCEDNGVDAESVAQQRPIRNCMSRAML